MHIIILQLFYLATFWFYDKCINSDLICIVLSFCSETMGKKKVAKMKTEEGNCNIVSVFMTMLFVIWVPEKA